MEQIALSALVFIGQLTVANVHLTSANWLEVMSVPR